MAIKDTAAALLRTKGEPVTFEYEAGGAYDPLTGGTTGAAVSTVTANAYPSQYRRGEIDGTAVQSGDIKLICEYVSPDPEPSWSVTVDGKKYRVMDTRPIREGGQDIIFICQLRS